MSLSQIHFGKKIPIANCQIKDIQQNKPVEATLYEFDCKDYSDIEEVENIGLGWNYREDILVRMLNVYNTKNFRKSSVSVYALEDKDGKIVGLAQIKKENPDLVLNYIESKSDGKYKYIGQNLISAMCKAALDDGYKRIYIPIATASARDFYIKKCGFKEITNDWALAMPERRMKRFQKRLNRLV